MSRREPCRFHRRHHLVLHPLQRHCQRQCCSLWQCHLHHPGRHCVSDLFFSLSLSSNLTKHDRSNAPLSSLTTVCPAPTAGAYVTTIASKVYTVSSQTTITVTDCPCTVSSMVPAKSTSGGMMTSAGPKTNGTATTTKPAIYTGAAAHLGAGMGFLGAAAGAVMLL